LSAIVGGRVVGGVVDVVGDDVVETATVDGADRRASVVVGGIVGATTDAGAEVAGAPASATSDAIP
jgi:hypothetical protein